MSDKNDIGHQYADYINTLTTSITKQDEEKLRLLDRHIGERLRLKRTDLEIDLDDMADRLGISSETFRRYEDGIESIPADVLYFVAQEMEVRVSFFFEGCQSDPPGPDLVAEIIKRPETLDLIRQFLFLEPELQGHVIYLVKMLAQSVAKRGNSQIH